MKTHGKTTDINKSDIVLCFDGQLAAVVEKGLHEKSLGFYRIFALRVQRRLRCNIRFLFGHIQSSAVTEHSEKNNQ